MSTEQIIRMVKEISIEEGVSVEEAGSAMLAFARSVIKNLSVGEQVEFFGPSNNHSDETLRYFIKKLSDDGFLCDRCQ